MVNQSKNASILLPHRVNQQLTSHEPYEIWFELRTYYTKKEKKKQKVKILRYFIEKMTECKLKFVHFYYL